MALGLDLAWMLVALASPEAHRIWEGEGSPVEDFEVGLVLVYIATWAWIAARLRRSEGHPLRWRLALGMIVQLVVIVGEELDWLGALPFARNLRQASRAFLPQILDSPMAGAYLVFFLFVPLVPLAAVRSFLERAAPVRAEPADGVAVIAGLLSSILVYFVIGDQALGELHQLVAYAVLGVITVRVVRALRS